MGNKSTEKYKYAGVILETIDGKLIFQERPTKPGVIHPGEVSIFGGEVEKGEKPIDAAIREINEELELVLNKKNLEFLGIYEKTKKIHGAEGVCYIYIARGIDPHMLELREGENIILFSRKENFNKHKFTVLARQLIKDFFDKNPA
ncbi:MAG: NUDIX hydrolase [Patescibacteria group bacterium]|nr:NUDIX hydrolase [Patescibacteria group bacterium]